MNSMNVDALIQRVKRMKVGAKIPVTELRYYPHENWGTEYAFKPKSFVDKENRVDVLRAVKTLLRLIVGDTSL